MSRQAQLAVLLIDNYDSFTYNLYQYLGELGAQTRVVRNDELGVAEALALHPDRIVISPGPGTPDQAGLSVELIRESAGRVAVFVWGIRRLGRPSAAGWCARRI